MINEEDYLVYSAIYDWRLDPIIFKEEIQEIKKRRKERREESKKEGLKYPAAEVIAQKTDKLSLVDEHIKEYLPNLDQGIVDDYLSKNKTSEIIENKLKTKLPYRTITHSEIQELEKNNTFWEKFRAKYPPGLLIGFSRVGFNSNKNKALVSYGWQSGDLAGQGYYLYLEKENNQWLIKKKVKTWLS